MAEKTIHLKRTSLYASGASPVNMIQAIFYNEDMLIYDLEDSVPAAEKDAARFLVYNMVTNHRPKDKYVCIRVNGIYSEYLEEDLQAAVRANPDCIRIPKVEYAREVQDISRRIAAIEEKIGLEVGKIELICNIESYMGVINAMAQAINSIQKNPEKAVEYTKKYDQTLNTAASLQAAQKVNLATLELEQLPDYDPADPGRAAAPDPQKFKAMITLLDEIGALDKKVDLSSLDQAGLEQIARPWKSLHAPASAAE